MAVTVTVPDSATGLVVPPLPLPVEVEPLELLPPQLTAPNTKTSMATAPQALTKGRFLKVYNMAASIRAIKKNAGPLGGKLRNQRKRGDPAVLAAVIVTVVLPDVVTVVLGREQVTFASELETEQANETVPVKFLTGATVIVAVLEAPGWMLSTVGLDVIWISADHCSKRLYASMEPQPLAWS